MYSAHSAVTKSSNIHGKSLHSSKNAQKLWKFLPWNFHDVLNYLRSIPIHYVQSKCLAEENFGGKFLIRNFWRVKFGRIPACLLSLFVSRDIVRMWMVKFGKLLVLRQICQGFPLLNIFYSCGANKGLRYSITKRWPTLSSSLMPCKSTTPWK